MYHIEIQTTFDEFLEITLTEFKNHVDFVEVLKSVLGDYNIDELYNAWMLELPQNDNFSKHSFAVDDIIEHVRHSFDGNSFASGELGGLGNFTIAALA